MSNTNSTTIERLQCRYLVPSEHPAPEEVRTRLDEVARTYLVEVCGRWLAQFLPPDDPSVWLIRQLDIDLSADIGSMDNSELAEIWGRQVALAIIQIIAEGAASDTNDTVRHYADQAVYVAHFIADLARGRAWGKWYYRSFDSLRSLSTSAAIRTVMTREPERIVEVLLHLAAQQRLEPVLHSLSEYDALAVYEQIAPATPAGSFGGADTGSYALVELALSVWASAALELSSKRMATSHNALRLYIAMRGRLSTFDAGGAGRMRDTITHLLRFAEVLRNVAQPAKLVAYLIADDLTGVISLLRGTEMMPYLESLSFFQQLAISDDTLIRRVASAVATSVTIETSRDHNKTDSTIQSFITLLGGIFLLLPSFLDMKLHELIETALYSALPEEPEERMTPALHYLFYLLYLKCFGLLHAEWAEIAHDPVLLLLTGLEEMPDSDVLLHLSQFATAEMIDTCQQVLLERLVQHRLLEGRYLFAELVEDAGHEPLLLIRDVRYDTWVYARYLSGEAHSIWDILIHGLTVLQKAAGGRIEYLLLGAGFEKLAGLDEFYNLCKGNIQLVWLAWTEPTLLPDMICQQPMSVSSNEEEENISFWTREQALAQEVQTMFVRYLKHIKPASNDLAYLMLKVHSQPLVGNRDVDLALSLIARALMRAFARRMMGFDQSSLAYLYRNFLAGTGTVHVQRDLIAVQLPCPPLHTILRMAGVDGQSYTLPFLNDVQVTLTLTC